ncbi:hypothetical protein EZV62_008414 [Acer yangbiense]|uniref:Uncharacterized protein n=1 Tax=Acer yangbiense TaxID=1000413 RepID=A0A5C7IDX8_9ROSI|nr:hypothetical protein EZV62_008414 [Acer yangbiense]
MDDMLIASKSKVEIDRLKAQLSSEFDMKDLGEAKKILGIEIKRDRAKGTICLTQTQYLKTVLQRFGIDSKSKPAFPQQGLYAISFTGMIVVGENALYVIRHRIVDLNKPMHINLNITMLNLSMQKLHCGCIMSVHTFTELDLGGVKCIECISNEESIVESTQGVPSQGAHFDNPGDSEEPQGDAPGIYRRHLYQSKSDANSKNARLVVPRNCAQFVPVLLLVVKIVKRPNVKTD